MSTELRRYENAKQALAEYKSVDDVKEYIDKAKAVEFYARQSNDYQLEYDAACARMRASRKCGQLLKERDMAKGNQHVNSAASDETREQPKTLSELGVSYDQSSEWQKLADVPEEEFEAAISSEKHIPNVKQFIFKESVKPVMTTKSLSFMAWLNNTVEAEWFGQDMNDLMEDWPEKLKEDSYLINDIKQWVNEYE